MTSSLTPAAKVCIAATTTLGVLAIIAVVLRFYTRLRVQKISIGADDWCMAAALVLSTGIAILTDYVAATTGVGDASYHPSLDTIVFALKTNLALENSQIASMGLLKISLLLYYKRIFATRTFQVLANVLIAVVACFNFAIIMAAIFSKGLPVSDQWNPLVGFKISVSAVLVGFCAGNAALDLIILALPLTAVRALKISTSKRFLVSVIFSLGSFCIVASLVRLYYAVQYTKAPATGDSFFQKPFIYNILWALIEPPAFILAGCLLALAPLFRGKHGLVAVIQAVISALRMRSSQRSDFEENDRATAVSERKSHQHMHFQTSALEKQAGGGTGFHAVRQTGSDETL